MACSTRPSAISFAKTATFDPAEPLSEFTVVATEVPLLRVQVTYPDGRPALGAWVHCDGDAITGVMEEHSPAGVCAPAPVRWLPIRSMAMAIAW